MNFANNLKNIIKNTKITQQEIANKLGTTQQTISRWVQGINEPDLTMLVRLCKILNVSADELLDL